MTRRHAIYLAYAFIGLQLAVPASYYLWREDPLDERFAWRMFSAERMVTCRGPRSRFPVFRSDERPISLSGQFHEAWLALAERGRRDVIDAMARTLCERQPGRRVTVQYVCRGLNDAIVAESRGDRDLCVTSP